MSDEVDCANVHVNCITPLLAMQKSPFGRAEFRTDSKVLVDCAEVLVDCAKVLVDCAKVPVDCAKVLADCAKDSVDCAKVLVGCSKAPAGCANSLLTVEKVHTNCRVPFRLWGSPCWLLKIKKRKKSND